MDELSNQNQAIELLQQLGLKEYEAKCFVALTRLPSGTAKEISEISEVPRTRIYDAIRVLETKGLVEVQHSNPQQFRSVSVDEAVETLKYEYETRTESLRKTLQGVEPATIGGDGEITHEVWALSGNTAITNRTEQLLDEAQDEIVLVLGDESSFGETMGDHLQNAKRRGVSVLVGTGSDELQETVQESLPDVKVFVSGLEWLNKSAVDGDTTEISRLLLVDRGTILVGSSSEHDDGEEGDEKAVFGRGFNNGLVTIVRRLMATGLLPTHDPGVDKTLDFDEDD